MRTILSDRSEAGRLLAGKLGMYRGSQALVVAVPRGGVTVGHALAKALDLPLDIALAKKIGHPYNPEVAVGSVSLDDVIMDRSIEVPREYVWNEVERIRRRLRQQEKLYREGRPPIDVKDRTLIVVDDGIATGNTLLATLAMLRKGAPAKIVLAVPVLPKDSVDLFARNTDEFVYLFAPSVFRGVGEFYADFGAVSDEEVIRMLRESRHIRMASGDRSVNVP